MQRFSQALCITIVAACAWCGLLSAEEGILVLHVADTQDRPLAGVMLSTRGDGSIGPPTDRTGKTRIRLAPDTRPGAWVSLQVVQGPSGEQDWVFLSPWDKRVRVPPFENEADNFVPIVLAKQSDRALLENSKALEAITASILAKLASRSANEQITEEQRRMVLTEQAQAFGLEPAEVDRAIRDWLHKTKDPYEKGLAALYVENYPEATYQLRESLI